MSEDTPTRSEDVRIALLRERKKNFVYSNKVKKNLD